jgi:hypothetical protein
MPAHTEVDHIATAEAMYTKAVATLATVATGCWECTLLIQQGGPHSPQQSWNWRDTPSAPTPEITCRIQTDLAWLRAKVFPRLRAREFWGTLTILLTRDEHKGFALSAKFNETLRRP